MAQNTIIGYQCDQFGIFVGETLVQEDPKKPKTYLVPSGVVLDKPPSAPNECYVVRVGDKWEVRQRPPTVTAHVAANYDIQTTVFHQINLLVGARNSQLAAESVLYKAECGVEKRFQATELSYQALQRRHSHVLQTGEPLPGGFYWLSLDNTKVPFTQEDLRKLTVLVWNAIEKSTMKMHDLKAKVRQLGNAKLWQPGSEYKQGDLVLGGNGEDIDVYQALTDGKSGAFFQLTDGALTWKKLGNQLHLIHDVVWFDEPIHGGF